jgi:hypothetical protein
VSLGVILCAWLNIYYSNVGPSLDVAATWFGVAAALTGFVQWLLFRDQLGVWWVPVNGVTGLAFGALHDVLYQHASWDYEDFWLLLIVWSVLNAVTSLVFVRSGRVAKNESIDIPVSASRTWFTLLLPISLILGNLGSIVYVLNGSDYSKFLWVPYGILAFLAGLSFWQKGNVRNFGWIVLALFLLVDGINTARLGLAPYEYPLHNFAFGGIFAWSAGMFFAFHKETWRTFRLVPLTGYLLAVGLANFSAFDPSPAVLVTCAFFGTPAAVVFLLQRYSSPSKQNAEGL